jgi:hypothetical protein
VLCQQALDSTTTGCAHLFFQDGRLGRPTPGAHADQIVLDRDCFTEPNHSLRDLRSLLTIVDGRIVWGSPRGPWASYDACYKAMGGQKWVDESKNTIAMDTHACQPHPDPGPLRRGPTGRDRSGPAVAGPDLAQLPRGNRKNACGGT